jgi:hypothetical protein
MTEDRFRETVIRHQRFRSAVLCGVAAFAFVSQWHRPSPEPGYILAREIRMVSPDGRTRVDLHCHDRFAGLYVNRDGRDVAAVYWEPRFGPVVGATAQARNHIGHHAALATYAGNGVLQLIEGKSVRQFEAHSLGGE